MGDIFPLQFILLPDTFSQILLPIPPGARSVMAEFIRPGAPSEYVGDSESENYGNYVANDGGGYARRENYSLVGVTGLNIASFGVTASPGGSVIVSANHSGGGGGGDVVYAGGVSQSRGFPDLVGGPAGHLGNGIGGYYPPPRKGGFKYGVPGYDGLNLGMGGQNSTVLSPVVFGEPGGLLLWWKF